MLMFLSRVVVERFNESSEERERATKARRKPGLEGLQEQARIVAHKPLLDSSCPRSTSHPIRDLWRKREEAKEEEWFA
jgi:hypothetical protein